MIINIIFGNKTGQVIYYWLWLYLVGSQEFASKYFKAYQRNRKIESQLVIISQSFERIIDINRYILWSYEKGTADILLLAICYHLRWHIADSLSLRVSRGCIFTSSLVCVKNLMRLFCLKNIFFFLVFKSQWPIRIIKGHTNKQMIKILFIKEK